MKRITFKPPYRVGRKSGTTVLDSNGIEVVNFRDEEKAQEYVEFLNTKEKDKKVTRRMFVDLPPLPIKHKDSDVVLTLHKPRIFGDPKVGMSRDIKFTPPKMRDYRLAPNQLLPLMDEIGQFAFPIRKDKDGNVIPWHVIDHPSLIKEPSKDNGILSKEMIETWKKVIAERENNPNYEPCCDENNPCCCNTFSKSLATPEDVKDFVESRKIKYQPEIGMKSKIMIKLSQLFKKNKQ